ncbi:hypothetical protein AAAV73_12470 [Hominicoprocola fusiformis]|nr:hypothetical protein [Hominicoprocola fusiformis]
MNDEKEMTARKSSVGADERQSSSKCNTYSISNNVRNINVFFERRWHKWLN